jgi:hypothetical protein
MTIQEQYAQALQRLKDAKQAIAKAGDAYVSAQAELKIAAHIVRDIEAMLPRSTEMKAN